jgi:hypothetical protein
MYYADVKIFNILPCTVTGPMTKRAQFKVKFNSTFHCTKLNVKFKSKCILLFLMSVFLKSLESKGCF